MRKDEFNIERITNDGENLNFEFGQTQKEESTSYKDNSDRLRDEINDNSISNESRKIKKEDRKQRKEKTEDSDSNQSSSGGSSGGGSSGGAASASSSAASVGATAATVAGVSMIAVSTLSTLIGLNLFFSGKCIMHSVESSSNMVAYILELSDIKNDECIIKLENAEEEYSEFQTLVEGENSGEFFDLTPLTDYKLTVVDLTYNNYVLYEDTVSTMMINSYEISFDANGGEGEMYTQYCPDGETFIVPECDFTYTGKDFICWTIGDDEENQYQPGDELELSEDITLKANWATKMVTISFVANNGTEETMESIVLEYNTEYSLPLECPFSDPDDEHMFAGWMIGTTGPVISYTWKVKNDVVLTASWKECYIVTYESNTDERETLEVKVPTDRGIYDTLETCDFTAPEGYYFYCWLDGENEIQPGGWVTIEGNKTLVACWLPEEGPHVSFDSNGGDGEQQEDIGYVGQEYILPECTFTAPNGYAFDCWQLSGTEEKYNPGEGYLVESQDTITFIAVWGEAATLEFYPGMGAQGNVTSIKYVIGKEYTIPNGEEFFTAPENQEFDYWFDDMYSEQRHAGDIITIEDTYYSFTGHWKYLDGLTFNVTFETNGGSEIEPQVVQAGTNATKPDDPTKDDYIFEGWYSNSELTNSYNFITTVTEDITLYAKWSTTYSVSGEGFNGFPNSTVNYATESEINGVNLQVSAYSCYFNDSDDGHGLWIPLGYDSQSPEDCISYLANKTPINGSIKNIAITVGPSAYGGTSNTTLHVTFGTEPMLEHLTSGTTITYDTDATLVVECNLDGSSYFNITNVSENGLVIESIVVTYYVN